MTTYSLFSVVAICYAYGYVIHIRVLILIAYSLVWSWIALNLLEPSWLSSFFVTIYMISCSCKNIFILSLWVSLCMCVHAFLHLCACTITQVTRSEDILRAVSPLPSTMWCSDISFRFLGLVAFTSSAITLVPIAL